MRESSGRVGGACGAAAAVLIGAGLATMGELPGPDAPAPEVFAFFLDEHGEIGRPAALIAIGLVLASVLFATLRAIYVSLGRRAVPGAMLVLLQIAIGLQAVSLGLLGVLALRPEDADPATARALLDLSDLVAGISGAAFALGLLTTALAIRRGPGPLPARFAEAALVTGAACGLWAVRLFTDASAFAPDSFLGSALGWLLLAAWILAAGLWLASGRLEAKVEAPEAAGATRSAEPAKSAEPPERREPAKSPDEAKSPEEAKSPGPAETPEAPQSTETPESAESPSGTAPTESSETPGPPKDGEATSPQ